MSVFRVLRGLFLVAAGASFAACSLIADFDASKLPAEGSGGLAGAAGLGSEAGFAGSSAGGISSGAAFGAGGSTQSAGGAELGAGGTSPTGPFMDASLGGASGAPAAGGHGDGEGGRAEPPHACDVHTNAGCATDELCCTLGNGVTCRKTSTKECEACGVACPAGLTATCAARTCQCQPDLKRPCSGEGTELFCVSGPPAACVGCRDASDCAGRDDGKTRCAAGQCAQCDPSQTNAGCTGTKPICDADKHTCKPCTVSPNDCPKPLVCTAGGTCGSCAKAADCSSATSPICDATTTQCRPCASNAECAAGPKLAYCIDRTCSNCNPSTEAGCTDATKPDCRADATGHYSCQACVNDGSCANRPGAPVCDTATGRCVACVLDDDCNANAKTPFCLNNVCSACDPSTPIALVADLRCALKAGGQPVCIRTGSQKGQCGACDPDGARGCTNNQLCCENAGVAACVRTSVAQCAACSAPACDPLLSSACTNRECRCGSNAACSGTGRQRFCIGGSSCGECRNSGDCTAAAAPICAANTCRACATDAECAAATNAAGSLCTASGSCVPAAP